MKVRRPPRTAPALPPIQAIDNRMIVQEIDECGPAVAARIVDWAVEGRAIQNSETARSIAREMPELNAAAYDVRRPPVSCGGTTGHFVTTPEGLCAALNARLSSVSLRYRVAATRSRVGLLMEHVAPALDAGYPVALLVDKGKHWVLAYDISGGETEGFTVGILNPGLEPSSGQPFDLWHFASDHDLMGRPVCNDLGTVWANHWVAVTPHLPLATPAFKDELGRHLVATAADLALPSIDPGTAIRRLAAFDEAWARQPPVGEGVPAHYEGRSAADDTIQRVFVPFVNDGGFVTGLLVFDGSTNRLVQAALVDPDIKQLRYDRERVGPLVYRRGWGHQLWMAFRKLSKEGYVYYVRCDQDDDGEMVDPSTFFDIAGGAGGR